MVSQLKTSNSKKRNLTLVCDTYVCDRMNKDELVTAIMAYKPEGLTKAALSKMDVSILVSIYNGLVPSVRNTLRTLAGKLSDNAFHLESSEQEFTFQEIVQDGRTFYAIITEKGNLGHPKKKVGNSTVPNELRTNRVKFSKHSIGDSKVYISLQISSDTE